METWVRSPMRRSRDKVRPSSGTGAPWIRSNNSARLEAEDVSCAPLPGKHTDKLLPETGLSTAETANIATFYDAGVLA